MTSIAVFTSLVADGSMYNRDDLADPSVTAHREKLLAAHNITLDQTTRLHVGIAKRANVDHDDNWCRYMIVDQSHKGDGMRGEGVIVADAIVTTQPNHALLLPVADCIGLAIYDPEHHALMLSHLGRHSIEQEGAKKSVEFLIEHFQTNPAKLRLWATAAAGKDKYPLWNVDNKSLKEALFDQLESVGVSKEQVTDDPNETTSDDRYFSFSEFRLGNRSVDGDHCIVAMMN